MQKKRPVRRKLKKENSETVGLGVVNFKTKLALFYKIGGRILLAVSGEGSQFMPHSRKSVVRGLEKFLNPSNFKVSAFKNSFVLAYTTGTSKTRALRIATSKNLLDWKPTGLMKTVRETGIVASNFLHNGNHVLFFGEKNISVAFSEDLEGWEVIKLPILAPRENYFDDSALEIGAVTTLHEGLLLLYYVKAKNGSVKSIGAAIIDRNNPTYVKWRTSEPIWENPDPAEMSAPLGIASLKKDFLFYWNSNSEIWMNRFKNFLEWIPKAQSASWLAKFQDNPILEPKSENIWESRATFNPAAVYEDGKVHLLYRAIGDADLSVIGYASSLDGFRFDERLPSPIFKDKELGKKEGTPHFISPFMSGGGWFGGCEDPRLTRLGDTIYMTYVAYDGWSPPRVALTSISIENFLNKQWKWKKPVLISPPGVVDKNACLLPEKINGKFVIFHRIFPDILIDFVDDMDFDGQTKWLKGEYKISPRKSFWDSRKVGVGAPPLKTNEGWLLIYQAVGEQDAGRYKLGAMLLDLENPTKVLYRSRKPILQPDEAYENNGHKAGVAYPCGSVIMDEQLFVYYGGADTVVCVATANLKDFLHNLKSGEPALAKSVKVSLRK